MSIQRPADATSLVFRHPTPPAPSSPLTVGPSGVAVISLDGVVLGVVPAGEYRLEPQSLPFLPPTPAAIELWFVTTTPYNGVSFGGALGSVLDAPTGYLCSPRGFGDFSVVVRDPATIVRSIMGMAGDSSDGLIEWIKGIVLNHVKTALGAITGEGKSVVANRIAMEVAERAAHELAASTELGQVGLAFSRFGNFQVTLPEADADALRAVSVAAIQAKRTLQGAAPIATSRCAKCQTVSEGGRFCGGCGAPLTS